MFFPFIFTVQTNFLRNGKGERDSTQIYVAIVRYTSEFIMLVNESYFSKQIEMQNWNESLKWHTFQAVLAIREVETWSVFTFM